MVVSRSSLVMTTSALNWKKTYCWKMFCETSVKKDPLLGFFSQNLSWDSGRRHNIVFQVSVCRPKKYFRKKKEKDNKNLDLCYLHFQKMRWTSLLDQAPFSNGETTWRAKHKGLPKCVFRSYSVTHWCRNATILVDFTQERWNVLMFSTHFDTDQFSCNFLYFPFGATF